MDSSHTPAHRTDSVHLFLVIPDVPDEAARSTTKEEQGGAGADKDEHSIVQKCSVQQLEGQLESTTVASA
jgi:hypothetical protein